MSNTAIPLTIGSTNIGTDRTVRPALASDSHAICELQYEALRETVRQVLGESATEEDITDLLPEKAAIEGHWQATLSVAPPPGCATYVAIHGAQVGGFAMAIPGDEIPALGDKRPAIASGTEIGALVVDPHFQRSGHASRLLNAIAESVANTNMRMWISADDEARQRLVQSSGFAPAGVRRTLRIGESEIIEHLWWAQIS